MLILVKRFLYVTENNSVCLRIHCAIFYIKFVFLFYVSIYFKWLLICFLSALSQIYCRRLYIRLKIHQKPQIGFASWTHSWKHQNVKQNPKSEQNFKRLRFVMSTYSTRTGVRVQTPTTSNFISFHGQVLSQGESRAFQCDGSRAQWLSFISVWVHF